MNSSQGISFGRVGVVILQEVGIYALLAEFIFGVSFGKPAPIVFKKVSFYDKQVFKRRLWNFHASLALPLNFFFCEN